MILHKIRARLAHGYLRAMAVLVGGTVLAQALMVLVLPLLTRLYTPEDFSSLAVYMSILSIFAGAACLRFEIAIPLPEYEPEAVNLLGLALISSLLISVCLMLAIIFLKNEVAILLDQPSLTPYLWLLPIGIWSSSTYAALQYWATRKKRFGVIAKTRIVQSAWGATTQVSLGWAGIAPLGLVLGQMINNSAGVLTLLRQFIKNDLASVKHISWGSLRTTFKNNDKFPKYSTFESLANSANIQLPIIIMASMAAGPEAGFLMLAMRIMGMPMSLIGSSVAQVYLSKAPEACRAGDLLKFTNKLVFGLFKLGFLPFTLIAGLAPYLFPWVFGAEWARAGTLVVWVAPWLFMQFLISPVSMALHITGNQRNALVLQVSGVILRVGAVVVGYHLSKDKIVEFYAVSGFVFYSMYMIVTYIALYRYENKGEKLLRGA